MEVKKLCMFSLYFAFFVSIHAMDGKDEFRQRAIDMAQGKLSEAPKRRTSEARVFSATDSAALHAGQYAVARRPSGNRQTGPRRRKSSEEIQKRELRTTDSRACRVSQSGPTYVNAPAADLACLEKADDDQEYATMASILNTEDSGQRYVNVLASDAGPKTSTEKPKAVTAVFEWGFSSDEENGQEVQKRYTIQECVKELEEMTLEDGDDAQELRKKLTTLFVRQALEQLKPNADQSDLSGPVGFSPLIAQLMENPLFVGGVKELCKAMVAEEVKKQLAQRE